MINCSILLPSAVEARHQDIVITSNKEVRELAKTLQSKLETEVKFTQNNNENHLYEARFIFDRNGNETNKYVTVLCDASNHTYQCM